MKTGTVQMIKDGVPATATVVGGAALMKAPEYQSVSEPDFMMLVSYYSPLVGMVGVVIGIAFTIFRGWLAWEDHKRKRDGKG